LLVSRANLELYCFVGGRGVAEPNATHSLCPILKIVVGLDSSVGTATRYRLDGPGIESRWGRDFLHLSRPVV
jgi:hypothetical protein